MTRGRAVDMYEEIPMRPPNRWRLVEYVVVDGDLEPVVSDHRTRRDAREAARVHAAIDERISSSDVFGPFATTPQEVAS